MSRHPVAALSLLLVLAGCHIEDRTPLGTRRDEDAIQSLLVRYVTTFSNRDWERARRLFWHDASYAGPLVPSPGDGHEALPIALAIDLIARKVDGLAAGRFDGRILRSDVRQDGDLAGVWLTTQRTIPVAGEASERDWIEHLVLRRIDGEWRILSVAATPASRGGSHGSR